MEVHMKKLVIVLVIFTLLATVSVFAGGKQEEKAAAKEEKTEEKAAEQEQKEEELPGEGVLVGMATDVGGLGDKSFNDGAWAGLQKAEEELGVEPRIIQSNQMTDYVPNLSGLAEDGCKVVFGVGFLMADAIAEVAANYPDAYFAGIDIGVDPENAPDNLVGILYKEEQSGYLAGVVAGLMTKEYADASPKFNDENVVGCVLGMDIPPVERFEVGFYEGVKSVNPDCKVISVVTNSFEDQAKGKEAALGMIEQGADIIFQIAGLTGLGAINAAKEEGVAAIGVDVDQNYVAPDTVITSAVKGITESTYLVIEGAVNGTLEGGKTYTYGIKEDSTGLAPFHSFEDVIPQEVKDIVNERIEKMKSGEITVSDTREKAGM